MYSEDVSTGQSYVRTSNTLYVDAVGGSRMNFTKILRHLRISKWANEYWHPVTSRYTYYTSKLSQFTTEDGATSIAETQYIDFSPPAPGKPGKLVKSELVGARYLGHRLAGEIRAQSLGNLQLRANLLRRL